MAVFNEPQKWAQTLGQDADLTTIPNTAGDTDPSIDKIFPSVFSIPLANGGRAIPRSVLNGLFKLLGDWCFYQQNGGVASYSNTFDYADGAVVKYNNQLYICTQANGISSTVKAPTDSAYWLPLMFPSDKNNILIAHNAMPSNTYDALTISSSGTEYTAPADGYFSIRGNTITGGGYVTLIRSSSGVNNLGTRCFFPQAGFYIGVFLPCKKGDRVLISYDNISQSTIDLYFIYAVGSESEH